MLYILIPALALFCLIPIVPPAAALLLGITVAWFWGNPHLVRTRKLTHHLLALSIIGLGAGMDLHVILEAGLHGIYITAASIIGVLLLGMILGIALGINKESSILISLGTAICGGSAIAAAAPVLRAKDHDISVSLGVVFLLNAVALVIFPPIGHYLGLTEAQFGLWSALAIHDTSSVVGATSHYGQHALQIGTTIKLTRALWIIPLTFALGMLIQKTSNDDDQDKIKTKKPWFILGFLLMAALVTWVPETQAMGLVIHDISKRILIMTLFLIGAGLTKETIKSVGLRPLVQGIILWVITLTATLALISSGFIG